LLGKKGGRHLKKNSGDRRNGLRGRVPQKKMKSERIGVKRRPAIEPLRRKDVQGGKVKVGKGCKSQA